MSDTETIELVQTADMRCKSTGNPQAIIDRAGRLLVIPAADVQKSDVVLETFRP